MVTITTNSNNNNNNNGRRTPPLPANVEAAIRAREVPSINDAARRALNARRTENEDENNTAPVIKIFPDSVPNKQIHGGKHRKRSLCKCRRSRSKKMHRKTRRCRR